MQLIDIGINLGHQSYDTDREAVIRRAVAVGVTQFVVTGSSLQSTAQAIELAVQQPSILHATAGLHPHHAADLDDSTAAQLEVMARSPQVVAVGECGLDYYRDLAPRAVQRSAFERQLQIAARIGKPVFLHQREAHDDFISILRPYLPVLPRAVTHCFTGNRRELIECLELGLYVGITGWICDERRGAHLVELMPLIPRGRLMIETDGPYLLPRDLRPRPASRRNEPMHLPHIARTIAAARAESVEVLADHTSECARFFFRLNAKNSL